MAKLQRALLSVSDKSGLLPFARTLAESGIEILSTGGTAKVLRDQGIPVLELSQYTGFPEMLDGRVKTLHPKVHGGLLYLRSNEAHEASVQQHDIKPIDLVAVNLYPFEETIAKPDASLHEAIENIDIGGPAMLRSAAKNHESVTVIVDPADYEKVTNQIKETGETSLDLRRKLAQKVFTHTAAYDRAISEYLESAFGLQESPTSWSNLPGTLEIRAAKAVGLRYGENPHQRAGLYGGFNSFFRQLHGKELSYNNILDLTEATALIGEFEAGVSTLAILKHTNPCGVGQGGTLREAWEKAFATDLQAPFGGIIAVNQTLDLQCAQAISEIFSEVIIAPKFGSDALELLQKKKNLRLLQLLKNPSLDKAWDVRSVGAESFLLQERDLPIRSVPDFKVVTKRPPTESEWQAMQFGWRVAKHVKSNAIVYAGPDRTLGIGAGQMSRVDASRIAIWKAGEAKLSLKGSAVCSDAFFPFADGLIAAAQAGASAAIQPGGSVRDSEVIAAADEQGMAMVFTGVRHFRH